MVDLLHWTETAQDGTRAGDSTAMVALVGAICYTVQGVDTPQTGLCAVQGDVSLRRKYFPMPLDGLHGALVIAHLHASKTADCRSACVFSPHSSASERNYICQDAHGIRSCETHKLSG